MNLLDIINMRGVQYVEMMKQLEPLGVTSRNVFLVSMVLMPIVVISFSYFHNTRRIFVARDTICACLIAAIFINVCACFASFLLWGSSEEKVYAHLQVNGEAESAMLLLRDYNVIKIDGTEWIIEYDDPKEEK